MDNMQNQIDSLKEKLGSLPPEERVAILKELEGLLAELEQKITGVTRGPSL